MGSIDITDLVEKMRAVWVKAVVIDLMALAAATQGLAWLNAPIVSKVVTFILTKVLNAVSELAVMQAFFLNTALRKASQAKDFTRAIEAKNALPISASNEEYENAEKAEMAAFRAFVMVTN